MLPKNDEDDYGGDGGDGKYDNTSSSSSSLKLLHDRVEFKLYAAEQHLDRLKEIGDDIAKDNARFEVEMEIDCFLSYLVGAVNSLLFEINNKLELGIRPYDVSFANVQSALNAKTKNIDLLDELDEARQHGKWYALLEELRNQSTYRTFLKKITATNEFSGEHSELRFIRVQPDSEHDMLEQVIVNVEIMSYLERSLQQIRELIYHFRAKQPRLLPS